MNVALFSNHFAQPFGHGIARYARALCGALAAVAPDLRLTPVVSRRAPPQGLPAGTVTLPWGRIATPLAWRFLRVPRIERWLPETPDVVHNLNLGFPIPTRAPFVVTVHDVGPLVHPEFFPRRSARWMRIGLRHALRHADGIICVSQATADALGTVTRGPLDDRVHVIHEGVDPLFLSSAADAGIDTLPIPRTADAPFILMAGAASPRKNLPRLLAAFAAAAPHVPHHLVLVGGLGWGALPELDRARQGPLKNRIHVVGYVSDEQLHALYHRAALFCYVSLYEGFGLPVIEAMACGCPVLAANTTSLPEIGGDAAHYVDPADTHAIAQSFVTLTTDTALADHLRAAGRTRAAQFTWCACAEQTAAVYRQVAGTHHRTSVPVVASALSETK